MIDEKLIQGAGGGSKGGASGQRTPIEEDDSLKSEQFISVLDLLCEGEIEGLDDNAKSIFLDDTPVQNADGSTNFDNFTIALAFGTQAQPHIPNPSGGIQTERAVNVEVTQSTPVTRTITNSEIDRVRVTITVPSLQVVEEDGDIVGNTVDIKMQIQYDGGGYNDVLTDTISGKSSSRYQRDYLLELNGSFPVDLRVVRVSADETT